jgi:hypothetical protein
VATVSTWLACTISAIGSPFPLGRRRMPPGVPLQCDA